MMRMWHARALRGVNLPNAMKAANRITCACLKIIDGFSSPELKVALVSYHYKEPTMSGVGIHARNLAKYLRRRRCEVHVFCSGPRDAVYKENGVVVHAIGKILSPVQDQFSQKMLGYDIFESEVVREFIRENTKRRFDVIHTHGSLTKAAFLLKKVYGTRWVHTFHAVEKLRAAKLSKEEKQFEDLVSWIESTVNHCDGAIFVSRKLMVEGGRHYRIASKTVIPNGVNLETFKQSQIRKKNVLFVGRFSKEKGVGALPRIIDAVLSDSDATFTAVCPHFDLPWEMKKIRKALKARQGKFKGRLTMVESPQSQGALKHLYKNCQVYIQPSKYESFGLCMLEAMATGRPVVALDVGGVPEVIGDAGFVVGNVDEMIRTVKALLKNRRMCASVGRKANRRARGFDWDAIAKRTIKYYGAKNER